MQWRGIITKFVGNWVSLKRLLFINFTVIPLHWNGHNSYVFGANWKIPVPSTAHGPQHGTLGRHVASVTWLQTFLKVSQLFVQNLQKPFMIDLGTHSRLICDALRSICSIGDLCLWPLGPPSKLFYSSVSYYDQCWTLVIIFGHIMMAKG